MCFCLDDMNICEKNKIIEREKGHKKVLNCEQKIITKKKSRDGNFPPLNSFNNVTLLNDFSHDFFLFRNN